MILFRLSYNPVIRVYNGYGNSEKIILFGHVLKMSPMRRTAFRQNWIVNTFSMLRLFMVLPFKNARVSMEWEGFILYTDTQDNGYFKFEWSPSIPPRPGWHNILVNLESEKYLSQNISGNGQVLIPFNSSLAFISDIDDTFLVSHSSRLSKRLYVLLTKNARTRKPFEGVINHYKLLSVSGCPEGQSHPFFYVSSSEWNLFYFIKEFSKKNGLPKGVYMLNELKKIGKIWKTGQTKHATKFFRIVRIIESFPNRRIILFGDDSQEDPRIYAALAEYFGANIFAVYIRKVNKAKYPEVQVIINGIVEKGIHCCYFFHSAEAIAHSESIGLII